MNKIIELKKNETKTILYEKPNILEITLNAGSRLSLILFAHQPTRDYHRSNVTVVFKGRQAEAKILGICIGTKEEKYKITTNLIHEVPNTKCITNVRGVLMGKSSLNYVGKIVINRGAQKTKSFLENRVLLLGNGSKSESSPLLEIEANDVKTGHSTAIGKISKEEIFYLRSRGLDQSSAEKLIMEGFFEPIINEIGIKKIAGMMRVKVGKGLERKNPKP